MTAHTTTRAPDPKRRALDAIERGPIRELELTDADKLGLDNEARMSLSKKVVFLRAFAQRGIVLDGIAVAGVGRGTVRYWRESDEWFEALFQAAMEEAADALEAEAVRRAVVGVEEPVVFQGMPTMLQDKETGEQRMFTVNKKSDKLLEFLLKGQRAERYRDQSKVQHDFGGQTGVLVVPAPPQDWARVAAEQQQKFAGNAGEEKK